LGQRDEEERFTMHVPALQCMQTQDGRLMKGKVLGNTQGITKGKLEGKTKDEGHTSPS